MGALLGDGKKMNVPRQFPGGGRTGREWKRAGYTELPIMSAVEKHLLGQ